MHIPDKHRATQLFESLDPDRKAFVTALAARYGALSPANTSDYKPLKQAFTLELQARLSPDVAAKIAYTSEDLLIPLALALVRMKAEKAAAAERAEFIKNFMLVFAGTLILLFAGYLAWGYFTTPRGPSNAPAAGTSAPSSGSGSTGR
jgi:hypothetical protein